jgi:hypothetical protein
MFGLIDVASIATIVASFAFVMYNIRVELKTKI